MTPLPIDPALPDIVQSLRQCPSLVLVAPPGAGKTTRVPPAILRAGLLPAEHPNLVMLQPRRIAARAAAIRIAQENGWTVGREVGYHIRFERAIAPTTRLRVLTEGILTRQLLADPLLDGVGAVLLDEFHERSIHTDLAIALLRELQSARPELLLVVMSATLDADKAAQYLGGCPVIRVEGRMFPVQVQYEPREHEPLPHRVAAALQRTLNEPGDVLVFLPGMDEIRRTRRAIEPLAQQNDLLVLPLHGSLSAEEQIAAICPADRRKVVLATNIAETSLTIDGVRTVIDSGLARVVEYDPHRGLERLELRRISRASADQRAGRAGRTAPGIAIRLWSQKQHHALADFQTPEVRRIDLAATVLAVLAWGHADPFTFPWFEPPPREALDSALRLLVMLGAATDGTPARLTPLGQRMLRLPVHPRLARLLVEAVRSGMAEEGAAIAAILSEKDFLTWDRPEGMQIRTGGVHSQSDLLVRLDLLRQAEAARFAASLRDRQIEVSAARHVCRTRDQLLRIARRIRCEHRPADRDQTLLKLPLLAYPDRVVRRRERDPSAGTMVGGGGVRLAQESSVRDGELFVALDVRQDHRSDRQESLVRIASAIRPQWLQELFPHSIRREQAVEFDPQRRQVVGVVRLWYRDLLLRQSAGAPVDPHQAGALLADALRNEARGIFEANEAAARLLARVDLLRRHMPEHPWPALDDAQLAQLLADSSHGKRSIDDIRRSNLADLLRGLLPYPLDRLLDEHAPEAIQVPSGSRIRLAYTVGRPPVLAVRLQEVFGWTDTPRVAAGRVRVLLHLLGPNHRPVQITDDLRSFWKTTYFQVRKDLRVRYPKHAWPEDPLTARPQAKGGRKR